jgi:hypothetical protein
VADSAFRRGLGLLNTGIRGHTDSEVIGGQMAAHLLTGGSTFYQSHAMCAIIPEHFAELADHGRISITRMQRHAACGILDFIYRPQALRHLSWWELVADYQPSKPDVKGCMPFEVGHPSQGHGVRRRRRACLPRYIGKRLANIDNLCAGSDSNANTHTDEQRQHYAMVAIALFGAWTDPKTVRRASESWWDALRRAGEGFLRPIGYAVLASMQEYHRSIGVKRVDEQLPPGVSMVTFTYAIPALSTSNRS